MEIKFRAWDEKDKKMVDSSQRDILIDAFTGKVALLQYGYEFVDTQSLEQAEIILMQSTGLTDKNGVEIYEGDIVKVFYGNEHGETQVTYNYVMKNPFEYDLGEAAWLIYAHELRVIGNIYENQGLLGDGLK